MQVETVPASVPEACRSQLQAAVVDIEGHGGGEEREIAADDVVDDLLALSSGFWLGHQPPTESTSRVDESIPSARLSRVEALTRLPATLR